MERRVLLVTRLWRSCRRRRPRAARRGHRRQRHVHGRSGLRPDVRRRDSATIRCARAAPRVSSTCTGDGAECTVDCIGNANCTNASQRRRELPDRLRDERYLQRELRSRFGRLRARLRRRLDVHGDVPPKAGAGTNAWTTRRARSAATVVIASSSARATRTVPSPVPVAVALTTAIRRAPACTLELPIGGRPARSVGSVPDPLVLAGSPRQSRVVRSVVFDIIPLWLGLLVVGLPVTLASAFLVQQRLQGFARCTIRRSGAIRSPTSRVWSTRARAYFVPRRRVALREKAIPRAVGSERLAWSVREGARRSCRALRGGFLPPLHDAVLRARARRCRLDALRQRAREPVHEARGLSFAIEAPLSAR